MFRSLIPLSAVFATALLCPSASAETVTFESLLSSPNSFYNGNTGVANSDGWSSGGVFFNNTYSIDPQFGGFWSGWSYSNIEDATTPNFGNQYASSPGGGNMIGGGLDEGGTYAVAFGDGAYFNIPTGFVIGSVDWTNTTYAYLSMLNGDAGNGTMGPGDQFGDDDFFRVTLTGYTGADLSGSETGSVLLSLATGGGDDIVNDWQTDDLTSLGIARSVGLTFESSDTSTFPFGTFIDTPTYLAIDNLSLTAIPEPSSALLLFAASAACVARRRRRR